MKVLVTGAAGFIGYHVAKRLLARGDQVVRLDNLNDYYDPALKQARLARLKDRQGFDFIKLDLADRSAMVGLFEQHRPERVVHLAGQVGVRYSIKNPRAYVDANIVGFLEVIEGCRQTGVEHLVFASSSSVYGANTNLPFSVQANVDHPISLYAATKKANELMAHSYSHLYELPVTGLRFFTVYGPWGRPDMAPILFTRAILAGETIDVFGNGDMRRDFTYIDDIAEGVVRSLDHVPEPDLDWHGDRPRAGSSRDPYRIYNIGNNKSVELMDFIAEIERATGKKATMRYLPMQPGDVVETHADIAELSNLTGFQPATTLRDEIEKVVAWYREFYRL